ncbi:hypothetical protein D3C80_781100 [compost metagenome]
MPLQGDQVQLESGCNPTCRPYLEGLGGKDISLGLIIRRRYLQGPRFSNHLDKPPVFTAVAETPPVQQLGETSEEGITV